MRLAPLASRSHKSLRREFDTAYRAPGVRYLGAACALGAFAVLSYYVLDALHVGMPWWGGIQTVRLTLFAISAVVAFIAFRHRQIATRYYAAGFGLAVITIVVTACAISFYRHHTIGPDAVVRSMERTMLICIVVVVGFSRLSALTTMLLAGAVPVVVIAMLWLTSPAVVVPELMRMSIQLFVVAVCCFFLRQSIEAREWDLFLMAKENLRRNRYAKQLETAKLAAEEADNAKSRFLANMSHEVRTPMNAVLQILDVVGRHVSVEDRVLVERGLAAGHALLRILNSILDYSKLAHGGASVTKGAVDVADVCRTVVDLHLVAAAGKGVELRSRLDLPPDSESGVETDKVKLFEVISNLVSNAIKFTTKGFVELSVAVTVPDPAHLTAAELSIRVSDSGCGLQQDEIERVFLPFYQGGPRTSPASPGTGLGLSIVRELVQILGGDIRVESTVAVGSTFTVRLPVAIVAPLQRTTIEGRGDLRAPGRPTAAAETSAVDFHGHRLLLVEDNELNAVLGARLLRAIGFEVDVAQNGAIAVDMLGQADFDVVLMDCQMPVMNGYDATRAIRELETNTSRHTPIIAVTAYALAGDREKCLAAGMDDFLAKPYSLAELRPKLLRWSRRTARGSDSAFADRAAR